MFLTGKKNLITVIMAVAMIQAAVFAEEKAPVLSSEVILKTLQIGNARFYGGQRIYPNLGQKRIEQTSKGQHPYVTVLACSDSRVPVEHIFDAGIGDIFVIKVAGNVSDTDEIGSIEYGTEHLKTPVLVVMGHSFCGAVTAVTRGDHVEGNIPALVGKIVPAVVKAKKQHGDKFSDQLVDAAIRMNVWQSIEDIVGKSHIITELVKENKLKIVGALYHLDTGRVEWLGEHPEQASLIDAGRKISGGLAIPTDPRTLIVISATCGIIILIYLFTYLLFYRDPHEGRKKIKVGIRLWSGFGSFIAAVMAVSAGAFFLEKGAPGKMAAVATGILTIGAVVISLVFSILFTRSIMASFHKIVDALKAMVKTGE